MVEEASKIAEQYNPFTIITFKAPFEQAWALRNFENYLLDMAMNRDFAEALLDKVVDIQKKIYGPFWKWLAQQRVGVMKECSN